MDTEDFIREYTKPENVCYGTCLLSHNNTYVSEFVKAWFINTDHDCTRMINLYF